MRPVARWLSTFVVAILLAALPDTQLRVLRETPTCWCPAPNRCHCFDRVHGSHDHAALRPCRDDAGPGSASDAPLLGVERVAFEVLWRERAAPTLPLPVAHEPPAPDRPPAPS
jgi:hypothetical protein